MEIKKIYDRQKNIIPDFSNEIAIVVGVGGIGNWLAMDIALLGVKNLILYDPDIIEITNLNRTLFKYSDVGKYKVDAMEELIRERRPDIIIFSFKKYFNQYELEKYKDCYIFDCTDNLLLQDIVKPFLVNKKIKSYLKLGYDGFEGTISHNDLNTHIWGDKNSSSYQIVPSFFGTPQILSSLGLIEVLIKNNLQNKTKNINVTELL